MNVRRISLDECIATALVNNRDLQAERFNPVIARATLSSSYGYYDPVFLSDVRREKDADTGGFDPANFSADAVYEAESTIGNGSIAGILPSGMSYNLYANYANSTGTRNSLDFDSYKVFTGVTAQQPLLRNLWIDQGRLAIRINKRQVKFTEMGVRFIAMDVINRVEQAYFELAYAHESQRVQQEIIEIRQKLFNGVRRQVEQGVMALPDQQLAQAQLAVARVGLNAFQTSIALAENALRTEMGDSFTNQLHTRWMPLDFMLLMPTDYDLSESWQRGVIGRPDLAQLREDVEKAKLDLSYRRNQLFPSLDVTAGYGRRGASTVQDVPPFTPEASIDEALGQIRRGDAPRKSLGLILTFPLSMKAERGNYKMSKNLKAQAEVRVKQKEELVLREISDAFYTARTSFDRAKAAREASAFSRSALEAEEKRLTGGTSSIFFVLQLQNDLVSSQLLEVRARADYNKALAYWRWAEGASLTHRRIDMEIR
ncbi:MAG TPA: TolC family protein [Candidatus Limnocylindria bacterium]|nr:TolC family protein [Candidatus Limnocylindria bacterium]